MVGSSSSGVSDSQISLVGREPEVEAISMAIERVRDGSGQVVLVTGPLGMGKSRVLDEAVRLAGEGPLGVIRGYGNPINSGLAYAPILNGVGRLLQQMPSPGRAKLVRGLDSLGLVLEGLDFPEPTPIGDPSLERTRLFESIVRLIARLSEPQPFLIAVDDAQWIDNSSLELVSYLATDLASLKVLLLLSVDPFETSAQAERILSHLQRTAGYTELALDPLDTAQVGQLARQVLDGPLWEPNAETLGEVSGGNPLLAVAYLEEMVRRGDLAVVEGHWAISGDPYELVPSLAREVYETRISRLDARARSVLEIMAIAGGELGHSHLQAVSGLADSELTEILRQIESVDLVVTESQPDGLSHRCAHPVISRVVYERIQIPERQRIHARFIEVLEEASVEPDALVWHYRHVGSEVDQDRRLEVLTGEGRRSLATHANHAAVQLLGEALDVARLSGSDRDVPVLLELLGDALQRTGEESAAIEMWQEANSLSPHPTDRSRLSRRMADAESNLGRFSAARGHIAEGMASVADENAPEAVALRAVGTLTSFRAGDMADAAAGIETISALAERMPSERTSLRLAILEAGLALEQTSYEEARSHSRAAYDMANALRDPVSEQQALAFLALVDLSLGNLAELDDRLRANLELAESIGVRLRAYRILLYQFAGAIYAGRWEDAGDVTIEAAVLAQNIEESRNRVVLLAMPAVLDILKGDFTHAASRLEQARDALEGLADADPRLPGVVDIFHAWLDLEAGRPEQSVVTLERREDDFLQGLLPPWGMMILGEAQASVSDERWAVTAKRLAAMGPPGCLPSVWSRRVEAIATADTQSAIAMWSQAANGFDDLGMPFEAARARLWAIELAPPDPPQVEELKDDLHLFVRLGASRYRDRTRQLLRSFGESVGSDEVRQAKGLSPRQIDVARLVAEGLSNVEIADRLFISRRTVTTHLENIYRQLGIGSRTALTRYVLEEM